MPRRPSISLSLEILNSSYADCQVYLDGALENYVALTKLSRNYFSELLRGQLSVIVVVGSRSQDFILVVPPALYKGELPKEELNYGQFYTMGYSKLPDAFTLCAEEGKGLSTSDDALVLAEEGKEASPNTHALALKVRRRIFSLS